MANDTVPVKAATSILALGTPTPKAAARGPAGSKSVPPPPAPNLPARTSFDLHALVQQLNAHLQSSGRPNHYRLDTSSGRDVIQEIDPDTSKVVSEIPASEFKALAQELAIPGLLFNARA